MNSEAAKAAWTPAQETALAFFVEKLNMTRSNAIRKLRGEELRGHTPEQILEAAKAGKPSKPEPKAKPAKVAKADKPKAERKTRESKYSKDAIIAAWERGRRPSEIALLETPGIKGVSSVYVSRVLFGSKNSGGVSPDQAKRVKVEAERREKRSKEIAEAK